MKTDPRMIDIDDDNRSDDRPVEVPVFSIETGEDRDENVVKSAGRKTPWKLLPLFIILLLAVVAGWFYLRTDPVPEVLPSVSDSEIIKSLKQPYAPSAKGTVETGDSILGVAFDMYSLEGLCGSLEREMPDTSDKSLVLFLRSADYQADGSILGTMVIDGEEIPSKQRDNRQGYVALSKDGKPEIGISLNNEITDYMKSSEGSLFRQFVLLGDGELPRTFALHGKVERAALGRMADRKIYYVVTRHKETMYDFADALREYGFVDAVYITGGNGYTFHRNEDGESYTGNATKEKITKYRDSIPPAPLLVFRNN